MLISMAYNSQNGDKSLLMELLKDCHPVGAGRYFIWDKLNKFSPLTGEEADLLLVLLHFHDDKRQMLTKFVFELFLLKT